MIAIVYLLSQSFWSEIIFKMFQCLMPDHDK